MSDPEREQMIEALVEQLDLDEPSLRLLSADELRQLTLETAGLEDEGEAWIAC